MAAHDILRATIAKISQSHFGRTNFNQRGSFESPQHVGRIGLTKRAHMFRLRDRTFFLANPNLFQQMIGALLIFGRRHGIARQTPMNEFDAAVGEAADGGIVRDHQDGVTFGVELLKQANDGFFVGFVEVASGLVGEDQFGMIDQGARDGNALLLASGKLRRKVVDSFGEADAHERGAPRLRRWCCENIGRASRFRAR